MAVSSGRGGRAVWVSTKREENQLLVFERKVLRTIRGPILEKGVYRRRYNFELQGDVARKARQDEPSSG
jgi:hypothetical protein